MSAHINSSTTTAATTTTVSSFPVAGLLGIAFVVLKLCGVIGWSWWWVTCPFWGPLALLLAFLFGFLLVAGIAWLFVALWARFKS